MRKDLLRRIERLEQRCIAAELPFFVLALASEEDQRPLGPGERLVEDWFRNDDGFVLARNRITLDPNDLGRRCDYNSYLEDVVRQMHETCPYRDRGTCAVCGGLALFPEQAARIRTNDDGSHIHGESKNS